MKIVVWQKYPCLNNAFMSPTDYDHWPLPTQMLPVSGVHPAPCPGSLLFHWCHNSVTPLQSSPEDPSSVFTTQWSTTGSIIYLGIQHLHIQETPLSLNVSLTVLYNSITVYINICKMECKYTEFWWWLWSWSGRTINYVWKLWPLNVF